MLRKVENVNNEKILQLLKNINMGIYSMIFDYLKLYSKNEISMLISIYNLINDQIYKIENNIVNIQEIESILEYENYLKTFVFRCWNLEVENGYRYVSWFKSDKLEEMPPVVSATFSCEVGDTFCDARYGINYSVKNEGFLGACNKDAATIIEERSKKSIYTIGEINDKIVNSYNLATPIITPLQVLNKSLNSYKLKYNEVILDSRYIKPISVIYLNDNDLDMVNEISLKYNIPIELGYSRKNGV